MNLVNSAQSITVNMAGAKTTTESNIVVEYQDITPATGLATVLPGPKIGNNALPTSGATPVTALAAAALLTANGSSIATVPRQMTYLAIYNADTVAQTYTIQFVFSAGLTLTLASPTLQAGERVEWTQIGGFQSFTSSGAPKTSGGITGNALKMVLNVTGTQLLASLANTNTYRLAIPFAFTVLCGPSGQRCPGYHRLETGDPDPFDDGWSSDRWRHRPDFGQHDSDRQSRCSLSDLRSQRYRHCGTGSHPHGLRCDDVHRRCGPCRSRGPEQRPRQVIRQRRRTTS